MSPFSIANTPLRGKRALEPIGLLITTMVHLGSRQDSYVSFQIRKLIYILTLAAVSKYILFFFVKTCSGIRYTVMINLKQHMAMHKDLVLLVLLLFRLQIFLLYRISRFLTIPLSNSPPRIKVSRPNHGSAKV